MDRARRARPTTHQRRHRAHRSSPWPARAACAAALAGVVLVVALRPAPAARVVATPRDAGFCSALQVVVATALYDRLPPVDATPEQYEAVSFLNADLARVRAQIKEACQ